MRLVTAKRRRSWAWWGVVVFTVVTAGAYVLFDILDVDESQLAGPPVSEIIAAEELQAETCRLVTADAFTPDAAGPASCWEPRRFSAEAMRLPLAAAIRRGRLGSKLPRQHLQGEPAHPNRPSTNPA